MTVTISLPTQTAKRLHELAAQSGLTLEGYLEQLAEQAVARSNGGAAGPAPEEWVAQWRAWAAGHRTLPQAADDSRESIYAGRGG